MQKCRYHHLYVVGLPLPVCICISTRPIDSRQYCEEFDPLEKLTHELDIEDVVGFTVIDKPSSQKTGASGNADLFIESEFCIRPQPSVL